MKNVGNATYYCEGKPAGNFTNVSVEIEPKETHEAPKNWLKASHGSMEANLSKEAIARLTKFNKTYQETNRLSLIMKKAKEITSQYNCKQNKEYI